MKILRRLFIAILVLLLAGAAFVVLTEKKFAESYVLQTPVDVVIPKGAGLNRAAALLEEKGVVSDARWFVLYGRLNKLSDKIKAGEYVFTGNVSLELIAQKLAGGDVIIRSITIPEGKALVEIKKILNENPYLSGEITLALKEGDILPETYHFVRGEERDSILKKARQAMKKTLAAAFAERDREAPLANERELLVLASIIEKETGIGDERAKVASVFANRLKIGMKLQTDPTVIYAVTDGRMNLGRPLYRKDLAFDSPFNTYVYAGLPPAPICSPGKAAIWAAAHPEKTRYLYFVADGITGGHRFAKSLGEHNANVALYKKTLR